MTEFKRSLILLAGLSLACGASAGEPASTAQTGSGVSGLIKFVDPVTGKTRQPTAAEVANLRARAAATNVAPGISKLPKTQAEAARSIVVARDGTETMMASQDSFSVLVQKRRADGSLVTAHGDVEAAAKEKAGE